MGWADEAPWRTSGAASSLGNRCGKGGRFRYDRTPGYFPTASRATASEYPGSMMCLALALAIAAAAFTPVARVDAVAVPASAHAMRAGDLSDAFWQTITPTDAFVQREPEEGGVPSQR